jgi:hypothetical protein
MDQNLSVGGRRRAHRGTGRAGLAAILTAAVWLLFVDHVAAAERFALVIAEQAYKGSLPDVPSAYADGEEIKAALEATGFDVGLVQRDKDGREIFRLLRAFSERLRTAGPDSIGFVYYSGHGGSVQDLGTGGRRNFLIPAGENIRTADDLIGTGVALEDVIQILQIARAHAVFLVVDACRNELPWAKGGGAAPEKAFVAESNRPGMLIAYATGEASTAPADGAYAKVLGAQLRVAQPHGEVFKNVALEIGRKRALDRVPWHADLISGNVFLAGPPRVDTSSGTQVAVVTPPPAVTRPAPAPVAMKLVRGVVWPLALKPAQEANVKILANSSRVNAFALLDLGASGQKRIDAKYDRAQGGVYIPLRIPADYRDAFVNVTVKVQQIQGTQEETVSQSLPVQR